MSDFGLNLRELVSKGMEAIGNTASNIATSTRQKVNELNTGARKKELYEALGEQVYIAWLNGEEFPDTMTEALRELLQLDQHDSTGSPAAEKEPQELPEMYYRLLENVGRYFGENISLKRSPAGKGTITIRFDSDEQMERFLQALDPNRG